MFKSPLQIRLLLALISGILIVYSIPSMANKSNRGEWEVILCNPLLHSLEMESTWAAAKAVGVKGIEISVGSDLACSRLFIGKKTPYRLDTPEHAAEIREDACANGLETPVLCARIQLNVQSEAPHAPAWAKKLIEMAPHVGAKIIYFPIYLVNLLSRG